MRLRILLDNPRPCVIPVNYQDSLTGLIHNLLGLSSGIYVQSIFDKVYAIDENTKRFRLFTYSCLKGRRVYLPEDPPDMIRFAAGRIEWIISSPVDLFVTRIATDILSTGSLRIGKTFFSIFEAERLPEPVIKETMRFTCLSPILAAVKDENEIHYLPPSNSDEYCDALRTNLQKKHEAIKGYIPSNTNFCLTFHPEYMDGSHNNCMSIQFKGKDYKGAYAPFTLSGAVELIQTAYDCGLGELNDAGFGMIDILRGEV